MSGSGPGRLVLPTVMNPVESTPANGRVLFVILFWFALATSVELWWLDSPARSLTTVPERCVAAGRITGMIAGFILLAQALMTSRGDWLERGTGSHRPVTGHRGLGGDVVVAVLRD